MWLVVWRGGIFSEVLPLFSVFWIKSSVISIIAEVRNCAIFASEKIMLKL